jgi:hypothetical protein
MSLLGAPPGESGAPLFSLDTSDNLDKLSGIVGTRLAISDLTNGHLYDLVS